jgi:salicylate hydroxylase
VRLFERAVQFSEVGAGVQLGPNAVRCLQAWGLEPALNAVAAFPQHLQVRSAMHGGVLATLALGEATVRRYGASYATIHRADLHSLLLQAVQDHPAVQLNLGHAITQHEDTGNAVLVHVEHGQGQAKPVEGDALIGADGLWSRTRTQAWQDGSPRATGHLAYRALVPAQALPAAWRAQITAWLGPRLHAVHYPVRRGEWMNLVVIIHGSPPRTWSTGTTPPTPPTWPMPWKAPTPPCRRWCTAWPLRAWAGACGPCVTAPPCKAPTPWPAAWWPCWATPPTPCRPTCPGRRHGPGRRHATAGRPGPARCGGAPASAPLRAQPLAARCTRTGALAAQRAHLHATGLVRWGRDLGLRVLGERLLDVPWLYRGDGMDAGLM